MQEFSKVDYNCILNGGCDKDSNLANTEPSLERIKLTKTPDLVDQTSETIKLEDPSIYSWHPTSSDIGSNLLRSSDDPLISGGTHDNQNDTEFPSIQVVSKSPSSIIAPPPSPPTGILQKPKRVNRTRKKQQFKLRFHHQALPPEYLDHYETSQSNLQKKEQQISGKKRNTMETSMENNNNNNIKNESVKNWLQKITQLQQESRSTVEHEQDAEMTRSQAQKPSKVTSYKDLPYMGEMTLENSKPRRGRKPKKADICHLIYKNYGTVFPDTPVKQSTKTDVTDGILGKFTESLNKKQHDEPLNLCVRDTNDPFVLSSSDEDDDDSNSSSTETNPLPSTSDNTVDSNLTVNLKKSLQNISLAQTVVGSETKNYNTDKTDIWSSSNSLVNPMALYFKKIVDSKNSLPQTSSQHVSTISVKDNSELKQRLIPKNISKLIKEDVKEDSHDDSLNLNFNNNHNNKQTGQKRKRSAIFIPPLPAEPKSHATEVSICKFKFTGGAKPSLQEKKMLSVDSGGNFRYYSGTGDKSMRGYEFFPRESLALSSLTANTTTNAFLNATSEKIDLPPPSAGLSNDILQIPEFPSTSAVSPIPTSPVKTRRLYLSSADKRKRKSKRSIQREKLEKTFKEKGFLIQTQQLQSAEGATYCKFRQLRKFTRYLFRSWKDHLPGDVQGQLVDANGIAHYKLPEQDLT
uniref:CSON004312 protein n=1 Tax=Culicoides sonorensis TaxID=179676 RepID=A0A336KDG8_CULSO